MMILKDTNKTVATKYTCEFCNATFARERTLVSHSCEKKQRWITRDNIGNRLGFMSWLQFYTKMSMSKTKNKTQEEFIRSPYYTAFAKFGSYCADANIVNVPRFVDWLLKENIKLDYWAKDTTYTKYLIDYLKIEDAFDAIHRSVEYCIVLAEIDGIQPNDVLRYSNPNRVVQAIVSGKISPWMLYCSDSGIQFLETINPSHVTMIHDYINPEQWAIKFSRDANLKEQIRDTLKAAGY